MTIDHAYAKRRINKGCRPSIIVICRGGETKGWQPYILFRHHGDIHPVIRLFNYGTN
jgi:hypothetical protein